MSSKIERIRIASAFKKAELEQSKIDRVVNELGADVVAEAKKVQVDSDGDVWLKFPWKQWMYVRVRDGEVLGYYVDYRKTDDFPDAIERASEFSAFSIGATVLIAFILVVAIASYVSIRLTGPS